MTLKGIEAKSKGTGQPKSTQPLSEDEQKNIAKIVYHELREATEPMTTVQLCDRTLLPAHEVSQALDALMDLGLCTERQPRTDRQPTRYLEIRPSSEARV